MSLTYRLLRAACGTLLCATCAIAQASLHAQSDTATAAYRLQEIVVYGPWTLSGTSMMTVFTSEDIRSRGALTVSDLLRTDAGLTVTAGPKAETSTRLRAFPAQDILVLVDGRPISPGYYGTVDLSMLPLENIAKISVAKGPASVAYGPNGMGGVIDIITQNGLENPRTVVEGEFGDNEFRRLSFTHSRQIRNMNYWLSMYEHHTSGFRLSEDFQPTSLEDGGIRRGSACHRIGADGKVGLRTRCGHLYGLALGYQWAKRDIPPTIYTWNSPTYRTWPEWGRANAALSGSWQLAKSLAVNGQVFVDEYRDRLLSYTGPEMTVDQLEYDSDLDNWTVGMNFNSTFVWHDKHSIQSGLSAKRDLVRKQPDLDEPLERHAVGTTSVFLQDTYRPTKNAEITAGLSLNTFGSDWNRMSSKLCPMAAIHYSTWSEIRVRLSAASAIRYPTLHSLYSLTSGNPDLKPEEADRYEAGLERQFSLGQPNLWCALEAVVFHNDLTNLIYRSGSSDRFRNVGDAVIQGWEARAKFSAGERLSGGIGYSRLDPGATSDVLMEEAAPNRWHASLEAETRFRLRIQAELDWFDERSTYIPDRTLARYKSGSLTVQQAVGSCTTLFVKARNLLDESFEEEVGYPAPGRQISGGLRYTL